MRLENTMCPKTKTRVILNILYSCKFIAMKFSTWHPIKRIDNLLAHPGYASTLPDITQKPKSYAVFLSIVWVALKRTGFSVSKVALKRAGYVATSQQVFEVTSLCLYTCMQPWLPLVNGFVDDALRNTVPSVNEPPASACQCRVSVFVYCQVV